MTDATAMSDDERSVQARRGAARRTAWIVGAVAVLIYLAFIASGVIGR